MNVLPPFDCFPPFVPPRWLRSGHMQTLWASHKPRRWTYGWTRSDPVEIDLGPDGKLIGEASWQPGERSHSPVLFLMHGLEGSARSNYLVGISKKAFAEGFHTIRINTRNCGGTEHLTPTLYCAGLSQDVLAIARHFQAMGIQEIYAAAVSLGANVLLKFLGEQQEQAARYIRAAAVMSPPIDLALGVRTILQPHNWIYHRYFLRKLVRRMRRKIALFPDIADLGRVERVRTMYEFDDIVTAPHFGFGNAENYYRLASSAPLLRGIRVPTLIIQAKDDPLIPFEPFQTSGIESNRYVTLLAPNHGGHTGFLGVRTQKDVDEYWAECRMVQFLTALARSQGGILESRHSALTTKAQRAPRITKIEKLFCL